MFEKYHHKLSNLLLKLENSIHHSLVFGKPLLRLHLSTFDNSTMENCAIVLHEMHNFFPQLFFFWEMKNHRQITFVIAVFFRCIARSVKIKWQYAQPITAHATVFPLFLSFLSFTFCITFSCDKKKLFKNFTFKNMIIHQDDDNLTSLWCVEPAF